MKLLRSLLNQRPQPRPEGPEDSVSVLEAANRDSQVDGALEALSQMADWVRFADAKAAVLATGVGVVLTALLSNGRGLSAVIRDEGPWACVTGVVTAVGIVTLAYSSLWLYRALTPRKRTLERGINRFAWPTLRNTSPDELLKHVQESDASAEAWRQVSDLAAIAENKFNACDHALRGFATFSVSVVVLVAICVGIAP